MNNELLSAALGYASKGWLVFPLREGGKEPILLGGFKVATDDRRQIEDWWLRYPNANIGLRTGAESGLFVVDLDIKNGKNGVESYTTLGTNSSYIVSTPSGGLHHYFKFPVEQVISCRVDIEPGVDIRGEGGYVVAPPSVCDGKAYKLISTSQELPEASVDLLSFLRRGSNRHEAIAPGNRNNQLFRHAVEHYKKGLSENQVFANITKLNESLEAPLDHGEVANILRSAARYKDSPSKCQPDKKTDSVSLMLSRGEFFNYENKPYMTIERGNHSETYYLRGSHAKQLLARLVYQETKKALSQYALTDLQNTLEGEALFNGSTVPVALRVAKLNNEYFIDLADDDWRVVRVSATGWSIESSTPVRFVRTPRSLALPIPSKGGSIKKLKSVCNVRQRDLYLLLPWMIEAFRPDTDFPILELLGQQGSAKSTTQERIRSLIDPNAAPLIAAPRSIEDTFVIANNNHLVSLNNLSNISSQMQDALCNMSTGGAYSTRKLYADSDEAVMNVKRPIVMNGITTLATAPDLVDRCITLYLPEIPVQERKTKTELEQEFEELAPELFGAILDVFVGALNEIDNVPRENLPRMADFGILGEAIRLHLNRKESFLSRYHEHRSDAAIRALDTSPVSRALVELISEHGPFEGTYKELLQALEQYRFEKDGWPKSAKGLANALAKQAVPLNEVGIRVESGSRSNRGRAIRVFESEQSLPTPSSPDRDDSDVGEFDSGIH